MNPDPSTNPSGGQPRQLNLQTLANQMMAGLQRHFDILALNLAAQDCVTEEAYNQRVHAPRMMPAAPAHQNFEQTQAYAQDLMQRQVVGDTLNLCVAAMNNCHLFLAAIKAQKEHGQEPAGQQQAQQSQQVFFQASIDEKFNRLENDYGILCELEDTVISLGFALQAYMQFQGLVQASHLDDQGELGFDLKRLEVGEPAIPGETPPGRLVDERKVIREGERVEFSKEELQRVLITAGAFFDQLFKSVARYAQENRPEAG